METLTYRLIGNCWHFSDGTVLPAARGGDGELDTDAGGDAGTDPAPATEAAPVDPAPPADPPAADDVDLFEADPTADSFPRAYVERLRSEAAARRTEAKAFAEAFEGYSDEDRGTLLDLARTLRTDPASAAEWMRSQAEALLAGADPAGAGDEEPEAEVDPDAPLTAAQLERYLADREARREREAAEAKALDDIVSEAKGLGFDPATNRREYLALLDVANNETAGDLAKAAEVLRAERQKVIDDYLAAKARESDTAPTVPPQVGGGRETPAQPRDWDDIGRAVRADIAARR